MTGLAHNSRLMVKVAPEKVKRLEWIRLLAILTLFNKIIQNYVTPAVVDFVFTFHKRYLNSFDQVVYYLYNTLLFFTQM